MAGWLRESEVVVNSCKLASKRERKARDHVSFLFGWHTDGRLTVDQTSAPTAQASIRTHFPAPMSCRARDFVVGVIAGHDLLFAP